MINGLQIWAVAYCRSVMAFYEALAKELKVPLRILCEDIDSDRFELGWSRDEFAHLEIAQAGRTLEERKQQLEERKSWAQWFSTYQSSPHVILIMEMARKLGCRIAIGSEAPSNGIRPSFRRFIKSSPLFYLMLRRRIVKVAKIADFIVNYSGDESLELQKIGWPIDKILPFGYYPPPLQGLKPRTRTIDDWRKFSILITGKMDWRRGQDVVVEALEILNVWGYFPKAVFTQKGEMYDILCKRVSKGKMDIDLVGFVDYEKLLEYYCACSVFVAPGRVEPWGMRINDALNAGAPLIVSRGMGGAKIVRDYGCGLTFNAGDALDLAYQLKRMMDSSDEYLSPLRGVLPKERQRNLYDLSGVVSQIGYRTSCKCLRSLLDCIELEASLLL